MGKVGTLVVMGGDVAETDSIILSRFVDLAGGEAARIVLISCDTAPALQQAYHAALSRCGVQHLCHLALAARQEANDHRHAARVLNATGILITAGNKARLNHVLAGSDVAGALLDAYRHGAVVAGAGAGARALAKTMISDPFCAPASIADVLPGLAVGMGFLNGVVIETSVDDPGHYSRLQAVATANPSVMGLGVDTHAALVLHPGRSLEVIGRGVITLLDPRRIASSNIDTINRPEDLVVTGMVAERLASGFQYSIDVHGHASRRTPGEMIHTLLHAAGEGLT